ncbi:efflux RND transporter permease subunit [Hydrogenovibrio sp. 3SP14C1]|uniref:efflux RND transporter permease subunit n=1 Tax=Hydrogenovibrio sp. 3SP14C1 TaxID=3038774 RepID=UPI0024171DEB|nr:efflux RND transporter permease subunit [Hydrogenovibrio sp. 3SP14C1]MDG4811428.1 efflux RND transporter permease subunit [Hydrogenovibrio sp. 3SP14C1]
MWLSDTSIKRPVLATVASLLLVAFGLMAFDRMSLREYPNVDPPVVSIETTYLGASAEVVESRITKQIEDRIAGVSGIEYISSQSTDGRSNITVEFSINRDIDAAANDIRDRVSRIADNLPVAADAPEVEKADGDDSPIIWFNLASDRMTIPELTDFAERYIVDRFSVLEGVARVRVGGGQSFALRVWLNPQKLATYGLSSTEIENQIRASNIELPVGSLQGDDVMLTLQAEKPLQSVEDFKQLVIKQNKQIGQITLGDVAQVQMGAIERRRFFKGNGMPMVGIGIIKQSNANTLTVAELANQRKEVINKTLPEGLSLEDSYDASVFVHQAVNEVFKTLFIALGLVVLVMLVFLKNVRAALVPAVTLPVSLIATFWVLWMLGFSVNLLTLLALVLAIGLVVDDAIVVLENTQRHLDLGYKPIAAAYLGTRQVGFAVIATTVVLVAVFLPIGFLEGNIGRLFSEFAITLAVAVLFSSWVALTLSPALASNILSASKPKKTNPLKKTHSRHRFKKLLVKNLRHPVWVSLIFIGVVASMIFSAQKVPQEYVPKEDRGVFFVMVKGPEGATFDYMQSYMNEIESRLMPLLEKGEVKRLIVRAPRSFGSGEVFNSGFVIVVLDDWAQRRSGFEIMRSVRKDLADLTGVKAFPVMRSSIGGRIQKPVQFVIGGPSYEDLEQWKELMDQVIEKTNPGLNSLDWDYEPSKPQLRLKVDYARARALGISHQDITETLQILLGSKKVTTFQYDGEEYDILLKADPKWFRAPDDLNQIYLNAEDSEKMIPLSSLVSMTEDATASSLNRYNRVRAITLSAKLDDDLSLGQALNYLNDLTRKTLPAEATIDYKGQSKEFQTATGSLYWVFLFGGLVVFLVLAAQFESFIQPFVIMLTVPLAFAGGIFALLFYGLSLNIYSQIALIMLLGLATKNGILIVEFTNQLRDKGLPVYHALVSATQLRLRPIVMTAFTTCAGTIPLILSEGAGAETRQILGYVLLWGVMFSTLLSLFVVPVAYAMVAKNTGSPLAKTHALKQALSKP